MIVEVAPHSIPRQWGQIEPHLTRALNQIDSGFALTDVQSKLLTGQATLWRINEWEGAAVTQVQDLPTCLFCTVLYLAGDNMQSWIDDLVSTLWEYSKRHGCKYTDLFGRPGWEKTLSKNSVLPAGKAYTVMRFKI